MIFKKLYVSVKAVFLNNYRILSGTRKLKVYRDGSRKSYIRTIYEQYIWLFREGSCNTMFNAFGLNIKGTRINDFIGKREFLKIKGRTEKVLGRIRDEDDFDYRIITKDKFYATSVLKANGIPCIENVMLITGGKIFENNNGIQEINDLMDFPRHFVLKNTLLEAGEGVFFGSVEPDMAIIGGKEYSKNQIREFLGKSKWVIQDIQRSGTDIRRINDTAMNITRIVTLYNGIDVFFITGFQAFATGKQNSDRWDKGAVYVGFDADISCLKKEGFFHPGFGSTGIVKTHPDSGIIFEGYKIRYLKDAVDLCIRAHYLFLHLFCIGWDIVITDEGPKVLEVNEVPGLNAVQCINGGIRRELINYSNICSGRTTGK